MRDSDSSKQHVTVNGDKSTQKAFPPVDDTISNNDSTPKRGFLQILDIQTASMRFLVILIISWILFYACMSSNPRWTVETYIPWSFWLLHYLVIFDIVGGGWPFVAPLGNFDRDYWGGHGRLVLGLLMTGLVVGIAVCMSSFFENIWPAYPLFPGWAWFGIGLFYISLWFVLDVQTTPNPVVPLQPFHPVISMGASSLIIIGLAIAIFQFVDFVGPAAEEPSNPQGPISAPSWFSCVVSIIVFVHMFASIFVFQGWPFSLLPHPFQHVTLLGTTILLGWGIYEAVVAAGVDGAFFADAIGASQISWSLYHTVAFDFWPFHGMVQPERGLNSFVLSQVIMPFVWIWVCRTILRPIYDLMVDANPMYGSLFTVHTLIPWYSLHIVAPLLLIHHVFFMRWPLSPGGPPLGPMDIGVVQLQNEIQRSIETSATTVKDEEMQMRLVESDDNEA